MVTTNDTEALRWAGLMGHPFAVTCDDDDIGNRRVYGECNDATTALRWAAGQKNGRAWRRIRNGYAAVREKAARPTS